MCEFKIEEIYGYKELKQFYKVEDGKLVTYGYSIDYDRGGKKRSETKPVALSSMGYS